ncbi:uncharacterized protein [Rutidosis leptorrhynchoides]|uniref:uncharacterized protein n=1 Tax=Rutidosis leptorrhynchoides TaxID=125765 RepID=UPI003A99E235
MFCLVGVRITRLFFFSKTKLIFGLTYFKVFDSWFERVDFNNLVRNARAQFNVVPNLHIVFKLRLLKGHLKTWIHSTRSNDSGRLQEVAARINAIDVLIDSGSTTDDIIRDRTTLCHEHEEITKFKSLDLIQKSRIKWDVEGDENSKFFHCAFKHKRYVQHIQGLMVDGNWVTDPLTFFLERELDDTEIKNVVWDCGSTKAPGPDGFSFKVIKFFLDHFSHDFCRDVRLFFMTLTMSNSANSAFFLLIPKVENSVFITDFRPISLAGVFYKIITKLLTNRFPVVIDKIISPVQSAFIAGRQILDEPLMLSEVIAWAKKMDRKLCLFKADFKKAYDSANLNSSGARLTLLNSVVGSLVLYLMSLFKCPVTVVNKLKAIRGRFFWGSSDTTKKMAWIKWDSVISSFNKGGLNVGSVKAFNLALLQKWRWRYLGCPDDLWVNVIKSIHGNLFESTFGNSPWVPIVESCKKPITNNLLPSNVIFKDVGNGRSVSFWHDIWCGTSTFASRFNRLYHLDANKFDKVADKWVDGQWIWNWSCEINGGRNSGLFA